MEIYAILNIDNVLFNYQGKHLQWWKPFFLPSPLIKLNGETLILMAMMSRIEDCFDIWSGEKRASEILAEEKHPKQSRDGEGIRCLRLK